MHTHVWYRNSTFEQEVHEADGALQNQLLQKKILVFVNVNPKLKITKLEIGLNNSASFSMNGTYVHAVGFCRHTSSKNLFDGTFI